MNDEANENDNNYRINNNKTTSSNLSEYKTKIIGKAPGVASRLVTEFVIPLKYLSSFLRSLSLLLINCEIELDLSWLKNCVISELTRTPEVPANAAASLPTDRVPPTKTTGATFQTNNAKLYVSGVTFSINDNIKVLENIKQEFKRTIS